MNGWLLLFTGSGGQRGSDTPEPFSTGQLATDVGRECDIFFVRFRR